MALTITSAPQPVSLAKNPVEFTINSDSYITTAATQSQIGLYWSGLPTDGDTFELQWGNNSITFEFVSGTPDDTGTQIKIPASFVYSAFADSIAAALKKNYLLQNDFDFFSSSIAGPKYGVLLLSKATKKGTAYNITVTEALSTMSTSGAVLAVDQAYLPNYAVLLQVIVEGVLAIELLEVPDSNGNAKFNISEILQAYIDPDFSIAGFSAVTHDVDSIINIRIKYAEVYGDPVSVHQVLEYDNGQSVLAAINGGVKSVDFPALSFFTSLLPTSKQFLTWDPKEKIIAADQLEQLGFLAYNQFNAVNLYARIYYTDGSIYPGDLDPALTIGAPFIATKGGLYLIPAGPAQLAIFAVNASKKVLKYDLWLVNSSTVISEVRTYIIDYKPRISAKCFLYKNSFGILSTLRTLGDVQAAAKNDDVLTQHILPDNYAAQDFEAQRSQVNSEDHFMVNTGFFPSIEWKKAFRDFLRSDKVYELVPDGGSVVALPVVILTKEDSHKESGDIYSSKFEYRYSFSDKSYSNLKKIL